MKKILALSLVAIGLIAADVPLKINGKIVMERHPLPVSVLSQESGGPLSAIDAYSDGVGVILVDKPTGGIQIDNSDLNYLVYKHGEAAKALDAPLKDYVLTNISDPVDVAIAEKLNDAFAEGDECDDGDANTINDVYTDGVCAGVPNYETGELVSYNGHIYCNGSTPGTTVDGYYIAANAIDIRNKIQSGFPANNICTSKVTDMRFALGGMGPDFVWNDYFRYSFNQNISSWDTSNVTNMHAMFYYAQAFNQPVNFDTSNVTSMTQMFHSAQAFNQPLNFDTSNVPNMSSMFYLAKAFNQSVNFNTSNVTDMSGMFRDAIEFNQPLNFNTSNVTLIHYMFYDATKFNQNISNWNVAKVANKTYFRTGSALTTANAPVGF